VVAGLVTPESIVNPDTMFTSNNIHLVIDQAKHVDAKNKSVELLGGQIIPYDKLILATGSSPFVPPIDGHDLKGVFTLRSLSDGEHIKSYLQNSQPRKLVFIGSGFISLEIASLLETTRPSAFDQTVIELLGHPLPVMLDSDMGKLVQEYLKEKGIHMRMGQKVEKILGHDGSVSGVELAGEERIEADMVFMNVGTRPNLELARQIGLQMGQFGIKVNRFLETSDPNILAGGDCVEKEHFVTGKPVPGPLRGPAVIQGRLAAKRIAGFEIEFPGVLNNSACQIFDKSIAATGLTEEQAQKEGLATVSATVTSRSKHGMIPGVKPWTLKLVFDRQSRKLIGGQIISDAEAPAKKIDTINALILGHKTIDDLTTLMCAGNPDLSSEPSLEPITIAAEQALQKTKG